MQHNPLERDPTVTRRLKGLPEEQQPYGFAEFQRRARNPRVRHPVFSQRFVFRCGLVAAVTAALALAAFGLHGLGGHGAGRAVTALAGRAPTGPTAPRSSAVTSAGQAEAMEGWLASLPPEPALARVGPRAAVASLEDRIALLDDVMTAERAARAPQARLAAIEEQRSQVLRSLVQVRYAESLATAPD